MYNVEYDYLYDYFCIKNLLTLFQMMKNLPLFRIKNLCWESNVVDGR